MTNKKQNKLFMIVGAIVLVLIILLAAKILIKTNVQEEITQNKFGNMIYSVSPCNQEDKETFTNITINENYTTIHQKVSYVCCANITVRYEINGSTLNIYEDNKGEICRCICNYEIKATIPAKNITEVRVYGIYYPEVHPYELLGEEIICAKEGEQVNRNPLLGSINNSCCEGLIEDRVSKSYSVCRKQEEVCKNLCGDGICQEIVCMAIGCPCAETNETCPEDCRV